MLQRTLNKLNTLQNLERHAHYNLDMHMGAGYHCPQTLGGADRGWVGLGCGGAGDTYM